MAIDGKNPIEIHIDGVTYAATVMQITEKDANGRPRQLTLVYPGEKVPTQGGPEFIIAYVRSRALEPKPGGA